MNKDPLELDEINEPCMIYRKDMDYFMQYGNDTIIFEDSKQALAFAEMFPMFFEYDGEDNPFMIIKASSVTEGDDEPLVVCYNDIADVMAKELEYQLKEKSKNMKGMLKDE